jgi:hypothetical protein
MLFYPENEDITLVPIFQTTLRHIPKEGKLQLLAELYGLMIYLKKGKAIPVTGRRGP